MTKKKRTCNGCKYFNACGDPERERKCDGYCAVTVTVKRNKKEEAK